MSVIVLFLILGVAVAVVLTVAMGMQGHGKAKHPELADRFARAAQHLNGDGTPPPQLAHLLERQR